jgi:hypothetical protein
VSRLGVSIVAAAVLIAAAAGRGDSALRTGAGPAKCKSGYKAAVVGGKRTCLKAGQTCNRKLDKQYHRYGFHCHSGRLVRVQKPPPMPPPQPPALPGQKIDVGGYRLYVDCRGSGSPTVIAETGQGGAASAPIIDTTAFRTALAGMTRLCVYDRAGLGASDPRPRGPDPTGARFADELHALLAGAKVPGPYVVLGPSFGGLVAMSHVLRYPSDDVGLVLVDSVNPCPAGCTFGPPEAADFRDLGSPSFGDRPTVVLTAEESDGPDLARRSTNSILASAPGSSHFIVADRPQLVIEAVRLVVAAVRAGTKLPPCEQTPLPAAGGRCETFTP